MPFVNICSEGTTETPPHSLDNTVPAWVAPSPKIIAHGDDHSQPTERLFIGPMPTAIVKQTVDSKVPDVKKHWWFSLHDRTNGDRDEDENSDDGEGYNVPERFAFQYFLHRGGREEDWESQESLRKRIKREMMRQLRHSGWASLRRGKQGTVHTRKWVGQTFKIGEDILGRRMQVDGEVTPPGSTNFSPMNSRSQPQPSTSRVLSGEAYHTALEVPTDPLFSVHSLTSEHNNRDSRSNHSDIALIPPSVPSTPRKAPTLPRLLSSSFSPKIPANSQIHASGSSAVGGFTTNEGNISPSRRPMPLHSSLFRLREGGGSKTVQFSSVPQSQVEPAPPFEVLARRPSRAPDTSAGAVHSQENAPQGDGLRYGDVIRRARMLVRRSNVKSSVVSSNFDAKEAVKLRDMHSHEWKEFLVVWRKKQLELYEDYSIPGKEMVLGHKHLACVIPLQKPDTHISLYSFVDFTFCLTCTMLHVPKDKTRTASSLTARIRFRRSMGTDIFVFKAKTRTSGIDWIWELWRQLGNEIPQSFEVHCPAIETRLRLSIPQYDVTSDEGYKVFTKNHVIELCREALGDLSSWDYLLEEPVRRGGRLELCWRKGSMLDWIRWDTDLDGMKRTWSVLYGLCLGKPREITHLEIRVGEHRPTTISLSDGSHLRETPSIEGYLYRIKPNSQNRVRTYLSTHGGYLFSIHPNQAHPPQPPIPITDDAPATKHEKDSKLSFKEQEIERGALQVLQADAYIDLRNIMAVRRAFQLVVPPQHSEGEGDSTRHQPTDEAGHDDDQEDEGGDEILARHPNKHGLRMRRSFELLMRTGHVVRFEAYSCKVAQEWVGHLRRLVEYWTHRQRVDASQEMELIRAIRGSPGHILARPDGQMKPERPPDYDESSEHLPSFWNWCVVDGCLSVVRNGRIFLKRSLRGQFRLMQLVLVSGHLIQFHITSDKVSHHLRSKTISLLDAYICSGHYATQSLPVEEFSATQEALPRRFQDGFESEDHELDTILIVWYRPHSFKETTTKVSQVAIPPLKAKHHVLVLKARSKLERDAWCWALNAEIERLSRRTSDRETKARDGGLAKL